MKTNAELIIAAFFRKLITILESFFALLLVLPRLMAPI